MRTVEQKQQEAKNYLAKTAKHIFKNENGDYFALVKIGDEKYEIASSGTHQTWETIEKYSKYSSDPKEFYKGRFFPKVSQYHGRKWVLTAVRRSQVPAEFLEKIAEIIAKSGN